MSTGTHRLGIAFLALFLLIDAPLIRAGDGESSNHFPVFGLGGKQKPWLLGLWFENSTRLRMDLSRQSWPLTGLEFRWGGTLKGAWLYPWNTSWLRRLGAEIFLGNDSSHIGGEVILAGDAYAEGCNTGADPEVCLSLYTPVPQFDITSWTRELRLIVETDSSLKLGRRWLEVRGTFMFGYGTPRPVRRDGWFSEGLLQPSDVDTHTVTSEASEPFLPSGETGNDYLDAMFPMASLEYTLNWPSLSFEQPNRKIRGRVSRWVQTRRPFVSVDIRQRPVFNFDYRENDEPAVTKGLAWAATVGIWDGRIEFLQPGNSMIYVEYRRGVSQFQFHATEDTWSFQVGLLVKPKFRH